MSSHPVSVDLDADNVLWLESQAITTGRRSLSDTLIAILTRLRTGSDKVTETETSFERMEVYSLRQGDRPGRSQTVLRPAVVLADAGRNDFVLCQLTSNRYADAKAIEVTDASFQQGSLDRISYARPGNPAVARGDAGARSASLRDGRPGDWRPPGRQDAGAPSERPFGAKKSGEAADSEGSQAEPDLRAQGLEPVGLEHANSLECDWTALAHPRS